MTGYSTTTLYYHSSQASLQIDGLPIPKGSNPWPVCRCCVLITALPVCPPGGWPGPVASFGLSHRVFQSLQGPPCQVGAEIHFLGPPALLCCAVLCCAVCRRSDSLSCPSLCTPRLGGTLCPSTLCFFPALSPSLVNLIYLLLCPCRNISS